MSESFVLVETRGRVGLLTLNRPKALNALNDQLMDELGAALLAFEADPDIGAVVITGSEKAFAAGADIGAMKSWTYMDVYSSEYITRNWETLKRIRKPVIAAVAGYALRRLRAGDDVRHHHRRRHRQVRPARDQAGRDPRRRRHQRLPRAVGKAKAMDLALTARMMGADEAERAGLVSRVVPADKLMEEALDAATVIASMSLPSVMMAECVNRAFEGSLNEGLLFERRVFHSLFATEDQKEGMAAFVEKRKPDFKHR